MTAEQIPEGLLEVGRFGRPHGVKGQIYIKLSTDRSEARPSWCVCGLANGLKFQRVLRWPILAPTVGSLGLLVLMIATK